MKPGSGRLACRQVLLFLRIEAADWSGQWRGAGAGAGAGAGTGAGAGRGVAGVKTYLTSC